MKNLTSSLLWFTAGVAITLIITNSRSKRLIEEAFDSFIPDEDISESDVKQTMSRLNRNFRQQHPKEVEPAGFTIEEEINGEFKSLGNI